MSEKSSLKSLHTAFESNHTIKTIVLIDLNGWQAIEILIAIFNNQLMKPIKLINNEPTKETLTSCQNKIG